MIGCFAADEPSVGIFWIVRIAPGEARLLTAGCPLEAAEPYGDFLTFPDGHYETWGRWRRTKDPDGALRAFVRTYEYEDWPRGRIVFDRAQKRFVLYADRKLIETNAIVRIEKRFAISAEKVTVETDFHYQSRETPSLLA